MHPAFQDYNGHVDANDQKLHRTAPLLTLALPQTGRVTVGASHEPTVGGVDAMASARVLAVMLFDAHLRVVMISWLRRLWT